MTAYNNHLLSQGALDVARATAAQEQREKDAALLRRLADERGAEAARLTNSAGSSVLYGDVLGSWSDYMDAETLGMAADTFTSRLDAITEQMVRAAYEQGRADGAKDQRGMDTTTLFRNGEIRAADILDACPLAHTHEATP